MSKKKSHSSVFIDMTPMVDVCMLLLTFFMLTTKFRPPMDPEITKIILPSSHSAFELPQSNVMTVSLTKDNKIFLGFEGQRDRTNVFGGEPFNLTPDEAKLRPDMEVDKTTLPGLLVKARIQNPKLATVVRGDKGTSFGLIEDVMNTLQEMKITRFSLVTELESEPRDMSESK
jgi:biopolymer transport protein ExbD